MQIEYRNRVLTVWEIGPEDFPRVIKYRTERVLVPSRVISRSNLRQSTLKGPVGHGHQEKTIYEPPRYACMYVELSPSEDREVIEVVNDVVPEEEVNYEGAPPVGKGHVYLGVPSEFNLPIANAIADLLAYGLSEPLIGVRATVKYGAHDIYGSSPKVFDTVTRSIVCCCLREARATGRIAAI